METYYIKEDSLRILVKKQKDRIDRKNCVELLFKKDEKIMDYGSSEEDQEREEVTEREKETEIEEEIEKEAERDENEEIEDESTSEELDINFNEDEYENDEQKCNEEHFEDLFDEDSSFEEAYVDIKEQNKDLVESMNKLVLNGDIDSWSMSRTSHGISYINIA
jgi:hypothetical protein